MHHTNTLRGLLALCILLAVMPLAGGCAYIFRSARNQALGKNPPNPYTDIKKVAITPFATDEAMQSVPLDRSLSYAEAFASELAQFPGFEVVRAYRQATIPQETPYGQEPPQVSGAESEDFAKDLDVDAVIIGSITEYDPYTPRIGITITLIRTHPTGGNARHFADLELLAQTGRPQIVRQEDTGEILAIRVERIFDSRQDAVRNSLEKYAFTRSGENTPAGVDQYLRESNYIMFVSNMMIRELIAIENAEKEKRHKDKD